MGMCKFCDGIAIIKDRHKIVSELDTDTEMAKYGKYMQELTVAIVDRTWYQKQGKKMASRTVHFRNQGIGYALNFCPECGRSLKR